MKSIAVLVAMINSIATLVCMVKKAEPKKLEDWQIADAERLKRLFEARAGMSQEEFGSQFDIGSQGMVWQYLNARRPLNIKAAAGFATGLKVGIHEISETLAEQIQRASTITGSAAITQAPNVANAQASIGPAPTTVTIGPFVGLNAQVASLRLEGIPDAAVAMIEAAVAGAQALTEAMAAKVPADRQTDAKLTSGDSNPGDQAETPDQRAKRNADKARSPRTKGGDEKDGSGKHRTGNN